MRTHPKSQIPHDMLEHFTLHPLCERLPEMSPEEYAAFRADVERHGIHEPLTIYGEQILDGRHRWRAARELGLPVWAQELEFEDEAAAADWVISTNVHRRHLSISQRALLGAGLVETTHGGDRTQNGGKTRAEAAAAVQVSKSSLEAAARLEKSGEADLAEQVMAGELSLSRALAIVDERLANRLEQVRQWAMSRRGREKIDWGDHTDGLPLPNHSDEAQAPQPTADYTILAEVAAIGDLSVEHVQEVVAEVGQARAEFLRDMRYTIVNKTEALRLDFGEQDATLAGDLREEAEEHGLTVPFAQAACEDHRVVWQKLRRQAWLDGAWDTCTYKWMGEAHGFRRRSTELEWRDLHGATVLDYPWTEPHLLDARGEPCAWCIDLFIALAAGTINRRDMEREAEKRTQQIVDLVWGLPLDLSATKPPSKKTRNRLLEAALAEAEKRQLGGRGLGVFIAGVVEQRIHKLRRVHQDIQQQGYEVSLNDYQVDSAARYDLRINSAEGRKIYRALVAAKLPDDHAAALQKDEAQRDFTAEELMGESEEPIWEQHEHWMIFDHKKRGYRRRTYAEFCELLDRQALQIKALQNDWRKHVERIRAKMTREIEAALKKRGKRQKNE